MEIIFNNINVTNFGPISPILFKYHKFWSNFINLGQLSPVLILFYPFSPILVKFLKLGQISQFWSNFSILVKFFKNFGQEFRPFLNVPWRNGLLEIFKILLWGWTWIFSDVQKMGYQIYKICALRINSGIFQMIGGK